jgi:hypothetical protein
LHEPNNIENKVQRVNTFVLHQNYPNPFNPTTAIGYQISAISDIELSIYNQLGERVSTLISGRQDAGIHEVVWDASGYASGIYYYTLSTDAGFIRTRKMILLK